MYIHEAESLGEPPPHGGFSAAAVAAPLVAGGITLAMVLEAIALVVAAIAAAYLLIRAYEEAQKRGIGVGLASRALSAGLGKLISAVTAVVAGATRLLTRARQIKDPDPNCAKAIADLERIRQEIFSAGFDLSMESRAPVPRIPVMLPLMGRIRELMQQYGQAVIAFFRHCSRFLL